METLTLTQSELVSLIDQKNPGIVRIMAETSPAMRKTGNPFLAVKKQSIFSAALGTRYKEMIDRETGGDFIVSPRKWGVKRKNGRLVDHDGKTYLIVRSTAKSRAASSVHVHYELDGEKIPFEKIAPFIPEKKESAKQAEAGLTGRKSQVWENDFTVSNIRAIKMKGKIYKVIPDENATPPVEKIKVKKERVFDINSKEEAAEKVNEILHRAVLGIIHSGDSRQ